MILPAPPVQPRPTRPGFTLFEVLISTALVSLVLGLALKGFTEANKIANLTKSKVTASDEATIGVEKMAKIIRRCHIVYFQAKPLPDHFKSGGTLALRIKNTNDEGAAFALNKWNADGTSSISLATTVPTLLETAPDTDPIKVVWAPGNFRFPDGAAYGPINRHAFRFMTGRTALTSADTSLPADERTFPSPLFYGAEATFNTSNTAADAVQVDPSLPVTWTFYVMYLAPMSFDENRDKGHALFPARDGIRGDRDLGRKADIAANPPTYRRTTVPYELRLLTVPDVLAIKEGTSKPASNSPTQYLGRLLLSATDGVRPFPHDVAKDQVNYDPVPIRINRGGELVKEVAEYAANKEASYARVSGSLHGNLSNLGNDPPNDDVFTSGGVVQRKHFNGISGTPPDASTAFGDPDPITDTLLARYIDPDATNGTVVRLAVDEAWRGMNYNRAYVNAFGGPQTLRTAVWDGAAWVQGELASPPKRALISVSTRYRSTTEIPFSFATESVEVDLEALSRYQSSDRISN